MARNIPEPHSVCPSPVNFNSFIEQKTAANYNAVLTALKTLTSIRSSNLDKPGVEFTQELVDEAMEELVDVLNRHGIGACQPGMRQKLLTDTPEPCWKYPANGIIRCTCYAESCPVAQWYAERNKPVPSLPMETDDLEFAYPDGKPEE